MKAWPECKAVAANNSLPPSFSYNHKRGVGSIGKDRGTHNSKGWCAGTFFKENLAPLHGDGIHLSAKRGGK